MVRRDIFLTTLIITLFIFGLGYGLGSYQDNFRIDDSSYSIKESELETDSLVTEKVFFEEFGGNSCDNLKERINNFNKHIYEIGQTLTEFDSKKISKGNDYNLLKRKYLLLQLNLYTLKHKIQKSCDLKSNTILFIFDSKDNEESIRQGFVLDSLVNQMPVSIITIDKSFEQEPLVKSLITYYDIKKAPTLIINYDIKKEGYTNIPEIKELLTNEKET